MRQANPRLMGWLGPKKAKRAIARLRRQGFVIEMAEAAERRLLQAPDPIAARPIWELAMRVLGRDIPAGRQEIGDCVSWGMKQAGERRQIIEIAMGQEERFRPWFAPWIYATSRNQVGRGLSGDGSLGVWAAKAVAEYGILFEDDEGVPAYSGSLARKWGSRSNIANPVYEPFFAIASDNPCLCVEVRSAEEAVAMIRDYRRPLTIASMRGFKMQPREYRGKHVFTPSGSWAHQMCWIEYDSELGALYRLNSWGAEAHGRPLNGETPGGAWNLLEDIEREFKTMDVECFALVEFQGEPDEPDHRII